MNKEQKLSYLYQKLNDDYMIEVNDWCDSDLANIKELINEIWKLRCKK